MIQIFGVGRVGKNPEMRYTPSGTAVTNISVACDVGFGEHKVTQWVRLSMFGGLAEAVNQYVTKGDIISFVGEPQPDKETGAPKTFTTKEGGVGASLDVKASQVKFINVKGGKPTDEGVEF